VVLGLVGLLVGRLGETVWAPDTERTATVDLSDPGPAVVIDPGVLYVGGTQGEVTVDGSSDISVITAANDDIDAYLDGVSHTRVTGLSDWQTLTTEAVDPDGESTISDPTSSDLWRSVSTSKSPATIDIADFSTEETEDSPQPYRAILLVTDGEKAGADSVSITWPVDDDNEWVPFAYAAGATLIIVGLVMLVVSFGSSRRARVGTTAGAAALGGGAAGAAAADGPEPQQEREQREHEETAQTAAAPESTAPAAENADANTAEVGTGAATSAGAAAVGGSVAAASGADQAGETRTEPAVQTESDPAGEPATERIDLDEEPERPTEPEQSSPDDIATDASPSDVDAEAPDASEPSGGEPATETLDAADEPATETLDATDAEQAPSAQGADEQRPQTSPIPVGGADGSGRGHEDAEGSEDPTEVIDRIEDPATPPRRSHRHRAATPDPEADAGTEHEDPADGAGTEEEQR
jgi:hypothetical protein